MGTLGEKERRRRRKNLRQHKQTRANERLQDCASATDRVDEWRGGGGEGRTGRRARHEGGGENTRDDSRRRN